MTWTPNNAECVIPREHIFGTVGGVDFGPSVYVVARADKPMLLWLAGHSWSLNGNSRYSESHLVLIRDRTQMAGLRCYNNLKPDGGRLTKTRGELAKAEICEVFGEDRWPGIIHAIATKQTLIIEGGGAPPQPSFKCGHAAYLAWRSNLGLKVS